MSVHQTFQPILDAFNAPIATAKPLPNSKVFDDDHERKLADARQALLLAEAHLNGIVMSARTAQDGFHTDSQPVRERLSAAAGRVFEARHALDAARFEAIGIATLHGGTPVCTNDLADLDSALLLRLERNHYGEPVEAE